MFKDYLYLVYRNANQRKLRMSLTLMGIFVGITAIVALLSLSGGLKDAIGKQFVALGTDKLIVQAAGSIFGPPGTAVPVPLTINDKELIEKVSGVDLAVGRLIRIAKIEFNDQIRYSYIVSFPKAEEERDLVLEVNNYKLAQGKMLEDNDAHEVVIGAGMRDDLFDRPLALRDKIKIQGIYFRIVGILSESGNPQQDHALVLPEGSLRTVLEISEEYDIIPIKIEAGGNINIVQERIAKELRRAHDVEEGKEDFIIQSPQDVLATLNTIIVIIQGVLLGIAAISLLVGGIGIMNSMYTAVLQRTKEIGILKTIGAQKKDILLLFLTEAGLLGAIGGMIGILLGMGISKAVEWIAFQQFGTMLIQASFSLSTLLLILFFSFLIGAISGVYPAWKASKLAPIDALRK